MGYKIWQNAKVIQHNIAVNPFGKPNFTITTYPMFVTHNTSSF
jgi:hypothetical protein